VACKQWNELPAEITQQTGTYENPPRFSAKTWTWVQVRELEQDGKIVWNFAKRQCMHCEDPACAAACIVGALRKTPEGPVVYDDYKCIGCRYCTLACPFGVPTFDWNQAVPFIHKCQMCEDRQTEGMIPACAKACPTKAITFGERDALLQEARTRIQIHPDKYGGCATYYCGGFSGDGRNLLDHQASRADDESGGPSKSSRCGPATSSGRGERPRQEGGLAL
jgi:formate dehydrogenase iron-sulfur subunit